MEIARKKKNVVDFFPHKLNIKSVRISNHLCNMKSREIVAWIIVSTLAVIVFFLNSSKQLTDEIESHQSESTVTHIQSKEEIEAQQKREIEREQEEKKWSEIREKMRKEFRAAVEKCASSVRARTDARTFKGLSTFDAYVSDEAKETVQYFGTDDERFQFKKCMAKNNQSLGD